MLLFPSNYVQLGFQQIVDLGRYDFLLFILALIIMYRLSEWPKVVLLIIAYTMAHSLTLTLASMKIIPTQFGWIDLLVSLTILITVIYNAFSRDQGGTAHLFGRRDLTNYLFAAGFGLIHGVKFSIFFQEQAAQSEHTHMLSQLFAFNIGVEIAQLLVVGSALVISHIVLNQIKIKKQVWSYAIFSLLTLLSFSYVLQCLPF